MQQIIDYFEQYAPSKLRVSRTWRWGWYKIQINDFVFEFSLRQKTPDQIIREIVKEIEASEG